MRAGALSAGAAAMALALEARSGRAEIEVGEPPLAPARAGGGVEVGGGG